MEIGPINRDRPIPGTNLAMPEGNRKETEKGKKGGDRLDISEMARRLRSDPATGAGKADRLELQQKEKLRAIRERIESGFYSRPEIVEKIAEKLTEKEEVTDDSSAFPESETISDVGSRPDIISHGEDRAGETTDAPQSEAI